MGTRYPANSVKRIANAITTTALPNGAAGQVLNGTAVPCDYIVAGTLCALVLCSARTSTTTLTPKWQVSNDKSTWYDVYPSNGATYVAQATGTGSDVAVTRVLTAPDAVYSWRYCRVQIISAVSTCDGTNDKGSVSYNWREFALL